MEIVDDEMGDDYAKLAGLTAEEDLNETTRESIRKRLPWLVILLFLGMVVSAVVGVFESVVAVLPIVMCFQSLILDMAGNVGTQSLTVTIRVLMDENLTTGQKVKLIFKEMKIGFFNGVILTVMALLFLRAYIHLFKGFSLGYSMMISACVGVSLVGAMVVSSLVGTLTPIFFKKVGVDPAVASGPLITTINDLVAIVVVKQLFGGIGMNFANPALVGRIVLFVSFASSMNTFVYPDAAVDQLSSATPLKVADTSKLSLLDLFMGIHGGVLGETCALACVLGLIYLVATKTISIAIPASYIGSVFIFYLISTHSLHGALVGILSGGLMFGAVYMATDYVTSPFTLKGKLIYGVALGIVTFAIREWGSYAEGVSFALLFMNLWVPFINDWTRQTPYGYVKPAKKAKEGAGK